MAHTLRPSLALLAPAALAFFAFGCVAQVVSGGGSSNAPDGAGGSTAGTGGSGGAGGGVDDAGMCAAADAHIQSCGATSTGYKAFYDSGNCFGQTTECITGCIVAASCADLTAFTLDVYNMDEGCALDGSATSMCVTQCTGGCDTPLVLSFDGAPVTFERNDHPFDFRAGASFSTDWPSAATPWLALDRNGNGAIDDAGELFGSATVLPDGSVASNGFAALRALDSNGDGRITPEDEAWSRLVVWTDRDGDRVSSPGELAPLDRYGIVSIDLGYARVPRCDARGNCEVERATFRYRASAADEREGAIVDVHLRRRID